MLAKDESTGEMGYKEVVNKIEGEADELVHLIVGEEEISCTPLHPFYVVSKGWVIAEALQENDVVVSAEGENLVISKAWIEKLKKKVKIYNLTVADWHTYFVTESKIWVHNTKQEKPETKEGEKKDGTPRTNTAQNKQFDGAVKQIEKEIDKKLTMKERDELHRTISKQSYEYWEIVDEGVGLFGKDK